jgi:hypothetical protein
MMALVRYMKIAQGGERRRRRRPGAGDHADHGGRRKNI